MVNPEQQNLDDVINAPGQKMAKILHAFKTIIRNEKIPEVSRLEKYIPDKGIVFDIGAHFGQYAKAFSDIKNKSCMVYCFEPVDYTRDILKLVLRNRKNTKIFSNGFSDNKGEVHIHIPLKKSGKIGPGLAHLGAETTRDYVSQPISLETIDDFVARNAVPCIDFIKIDIEGSEYKALSGGLESLKKFRPSIVCEVDHRHMERVNLEPEILFRFFKALNYVSYLLEDDSLTKVDCYQKSGDYLFVHESKNGSGESGR